MVSLGLGQSSKASSTHPGKRPDEDVAQIDREVPYALTLITLMAASGITPYESFRKLGEMDLLPAVKKKSRVMVRQVEILGMDPLTSMTTAADNTASKPLKDILAGYVATVKSGGSVVHFLMTKMRSIFELQAAISKHAVERVGTLVEAFMVMLLVSLTIYLIAGALITDSLGGAAISTDLIMLVIFGVIPAISVMFMILSHSMTRGNLLDVERTLRRQLLPAAGAFAAAAFILSLGPLPMVPEVIRPPYLIAAVLVAVSLSPFLNHERLSRLNHAAEVAMPSFLRDIAEARKTGLSPEKCIILAARRKSYGMFTSHLSRVANQLEWGMSLRRVFSDFRRRISSWPVLMYFLILVEVVETGGGHPDTLEVLAEASEKARNIENEKANLLRPYVILPFMVTGILSFMTIVMIQTLAGLTAPTASSATELGTLINFFAAGLIIHAWLTGFFTGKVSTGSFLAGFKFSTLLVITSAIGSIISIDIAPSLGMLMLF